MAALPPYPDQNRPALITRENVVYIRRIADSLYPVLMCKCVMCKAKLTLIWF